MRLDQGTLTALDTNWRMRYPAVISNHQTSQTRNVWRIATDAGEFAVKVDSRPHISVVGGTGVQAHVAACRPGLAHRPVPTVNDEFEVHMEDRRITVSEWVDGTPAIDVPNTWFRIGETAAMVHALPAVPRGFAVPIDLVGAELMRQQTLPGNLVGDVVGRLRRVGEGPSSIVHGQLNLANVIEGPGRRLSVLDWDEAGIGSSAIDLGYPLICEFLTENLAWHHEQAEAFFHGYREVATTPLPDADDVFAIGLLLGLRSAMFANQATRV